MSTTSVDAIKAAIEDLPEDEKLALASWLTSETMDAWDRRMARDFASGGKGHALLEKVEAGIDAGTFWPTSENKPR